MKLDIKKDPKDLDYFNSLTRAFFERFTLYGTRESDVKPKNSF